MGLVLRSHPRADALIQQNVLRVERLKLRVFCCPQLLRHEVIRPQVQRQADDANRCHPQARDGDKQHKEVQPALVGERNPEDLRPEAVCRHHRVGLFRLGRGERFEGVGRITVLKQRVFHGRTVNCTQQGTTQNSSNTHHVERVQGEVVEALDEQDEAEDARHPKAGSEEPA